MAHDLFGRLRFAVFRQIFGRGKQDELDLRQRLDDKRGRQGFCHAQGKVEAFGNQIDVAVVEHQIERDFGIAFAVFRQPSAD